MAEELTRGSSRAPTERITTLTPSSCRYHLVQHQQLLARQMEAQQQRCSRALLAAHLRTHARQVCFKLKPLANDRSASRSERLLEARASKQPPAAQQRGQRRQQRRGITNSTSGGGGDDVLLDAVECHVYLQANDALSNAAVDIVHHTQGAATDMVHHVVHEMPVDSGSSCFSCCSGRPADLDLTNVGPRPVFGAADDVSAALDSIGDVIGDAFRSAWQGMSTVSVAYPPAPILSPPPPFRALCICVKSQIGVGGMGWA
jgi:hypothetical protein